MTKKAIQACARAIADEIMSNISDRRGFDLYSCDRDIIKDIRDTLTDIAAKQIMTRLAKKNGGAA